ncbi:MAG: hypothetical protein KGL39_14065 [Patescibacteria group bacterium]|nr:hypothetical protein [Patescibacteria group bacterium]
MELTLTRDMPEGINDTFGILTAPNGATWQTIELPWRQDEPDHSCVPSTLYQLVPHVVQEGVLQGLQTWCLVNPNFGVFEDAPASYNAYWPLRDGILIHPANCASQLLGCIAPGKSRGRLALPGESLANAVLASDDAFDEVKSLLAPDGDVAAATGHTLRIRWAIA